MLDIEKRNVLILAATQALFQTVSVMVITLSGIVGWMLAPNKSLATLPIALMMVAVAATMIPASLFMQRYGRKAGFLLGAALGGVAGLLAAVAIWQENFSLFVAANMLVGSYQAFAQYYRFAAADAASAAFKSRAISWVIAGGVIAAVAGPNLVRYTQNVGTVPSALTYLSMVALSMLAIMLLSRLALPAASASEVQGTARPLPAIMKQPIFLTALAGSTIGSAVMMLVMTATPLAMQICGQPIGAAATVIQWHVLGMFAPSFFTGNLIQRFGVLTIMTGGVALLLGHVAIALSGIAYLNFLSGLILLGMGWNFLFVGGTTLLTEAYRPSERAKVQATHDFLMYIAISIATFSSGSLLSTFGWRAVNLAVLPMLALALLMIVALGVKQKRERKKHQDGLLLSNS
ncbi:MAG: MFS transporter [Gallionellales bacterium 35-53-114]|jgi:MFS family permease|nr:MAG: MFS transporter [Gallionellales bacterium 35-53-114]OYZ64952.1 MAG: MFS transporter [Gallionellales bacterium 24-53-125]OZB07510.1 MAG: MFS transporter [Gallionellales bacterium 39-52-133]HQS58819.1 MFS transporter [Gallionellaceae bacterium]HQS75160.1 MFS transporter [Gallionellaceae bacterium]